MRDKSSRRVHWSADEIAVLEDSVRCGMTLAEIAEMPGRSDDAIRSQAVRLDLVILN